MNEEIASRPTSSFPSMVWPPAIPKGYLDAAAKKALAIQRSSFLRLLDPTRVLQPVEPGAKVPEHVIARLKEQVSREADAIINKHSSSLPEDCARAPGHLQVAALAISAQRTLLQEAKSESGDYLTASALKVRWAVADSLGVVAPPDGTEPTAVAVQYIPNSIALSLTGAMWIESRRRSMTARMMVNFETDLGKGFTIEPIDELPEPSRALTKCFYHDLLKSEGEDVLLLSPVFTALHASTWAGVPKFEFENENDCGRCRFIFR